MTKVAAKCAQSSKKTSRIGYILLLTVIGQHFPFALFSRLVNGKVSKVGYTAVVKRRS